MAKPPRGSTKPGEMCSYDPKTGLYTDRWLWEEILGEDLSAPFPPPSTNPSWTCGILLNPSAILGTTPSTNPVIS